MAKTMTDRERFPNFFVEENIDRRKCTRVVPMKVLVIGMLRTAMQAALEELGYNSTHHMQRVFQNPGSECIMWKEGTTPEGTRGEELRAQRSLCSA
ncbi:MAG: hypothetical protein Q9172_004143 [Xanthocarpia lactea]